jgi:hypothetical protein
LPAVGVIVPSAIAAPSTPVSVPGVHVTVGAEAAFAVTCSVAVVVDVAITAKPQGVCRFADERFLRRSWVAITQSFGLIRYPQSGWTPEGRV